MPDRIMLSTSLCRQENVCIIPHDRINSSKMLIETAEHGLHAIASQDMSAGTVVVRCFPLAHSLLVPPGMDAADVGEVKQRRCARCFFRAGETGLTSHEGRFDGLKRCTRCKVVYYCSRMCQVSCWRLNGLYHYLIKLGLTYY